MSLAHDHNDSVGTCTVIIPLTKIGHMLPHTFEYYSTKLKLIKIQVHPPLPTPPE